LHYCTLIDERFTTFGGLQNLQIGLAPDAQSARASFTLDPSIQNQDASLTASVILWWAAPQDATLNAACYGRDSS